MNVPQRLLFSKLIGFCADRLLRYETHDAHGFYVDAWNQNGKKFMLDPTPEDEKSPPVDLVVVRDETHHWRSPARVGQIRIDGDEFPRALEALLGLDS